MYKYGVITVVRCTRYSRCPGRLCFSNFFSTTIYVCVEYLSYKLILWADIVGVHSRDDTTPHAYPPKKHEGGRIDDKQPQIRRFQPPTRPPSLCFFWRYLLMYMNKYDDTGSWLCVHVWALLCTPTKFGHGMSLYERYSTHRYIVVLKKLDEQNRPGAA